MTAMKGEKVRLAFDKLHYTVPVKGSTVAKSLLIDIKGEVTSGHVLAILGPSGAGKTTLLNMLTLQQSGGTPTGYINVNGEPLTPSLYDRTCAYVEQTDTLWASLTVREHLAYATSLFRPELDDAAKVEAVNSLATEVGLEEFMETAAGNEITRGLSSGNKRRLSVALALVKRPSILFLDEPTSGLDSFTANEVVSVVKKLNTVDTTILATIHSPTAYAFSLFDRAMILCSGKLVFFGESDATLITYANTALVGIGGGELPTKTQGHSRRKVTAIRISSGSSTCSRVPIELEKRKSSRRRLVKVT